MCISFIFYYPRSRLLNCQTKPLYDRFHTEPKTHWWSYLSPLNGTFDALDWTKPSVVQKLKDSLQHDSFFYVYGHDSAQVREHYGKQLSDRPKLLIRIPVVIESIVRCNVIKERKESQLYPIVTLTNKSTWIPSFRAWDNFSIFHKLIKALQFQ